MLLLGLLVIEDLLIIISTNTKPWQGHLAFRRVQYKELKLNPFKIFINQIDGYFLCLENMVLYGTVKNLTIKCFFIIMVFSFYLQNALMTFEEDKMAKSLTTLRAMEKRCSSNLSWSPSFSSFQSMKSRLWGAQAGLSHQQTQNVSIFFANSETECL